MENTMDCCIRYSIQVQIIIDPNEFARFMNVLQQ